MDRSARSSPASSSCAKAALLTSTLPKACATRRGVTAISAPARHPINKMDRVGFDAGRLIVAVAPARPRYNCSDRQRRPGRDRRGGGGRAHVGWSHPRWRGRWRSTRRAQRAHQASCWPGNDGYGRAAPFPPYSSLTGADGPTARHRRRSPPPFRWRDGCDWCQPFSAIFGNPRQQPRPQNSAGRLPADGHAGPHTNGAAIRQSRHAWRHPWCRCCRPGRAGDQGQPPLAGLRPASVSRAATRFPVEPVAPLGDEVVSDRRQTHQHGRAVLRARKITGRITSFDVTVGRPQFGALQVTPRLLHPPPDRDRQHRCLRRGR